MNIQAHFNRWFGILKHFSVFGKTVQKSWYRCKRFMVDKSEVLSSSAQAIPLSQEMRFYTYLPPMEKDRDRLERIYHQPSASNDSI